MTLAYRINNAASLSFLCDSNGPKLSNYESNICNNHKEATQMVIEASGSSIRNIAMMMEMRKKLLTFRDAFRLPPCDKPIKEIMLKTIEDLHKQFPDIVPEPSTSEIMDKHSIGQGLFHLYSTLKSLRDAWFNHSNCKLQEDDNRCLEDRNVEQLGERVIEMLDGTTKVARKVFQTLHLYEKSETSKAKTTLLKDMEQRMDLEPNPGPLVAKDDNKVKTSGNVKNVMVDERCNVALCSSPPILAVVPQSTELPLLKEASSSEATSAIGVLPISVSQPPTPPPVQPPMKTTPPPPPPLGAKKVLAPLKSNTKLRRSTKFGNLYRQLKRKLDGSSTPIRKSEGKRFKIGTLNGSNEGMTGAIEEMMKRSSYYQQIEKDVQNHGNKINEIKSSIIAFKNKDMQELIKFHKYIETILEPLTDETQVLARFEGFPRAKLESIRSAAALHTKLDGMLEALKTWNIVAPLDQLLDKIENYFTKLKLELDELERHKDEDSKRFESENIHFNFQIIQKIKESMVDVSSGCIELALKERRRTMDNKGNRSVKLLWRAFQLAFRVYIFAGGQDDQAERLTTELAKEIEANCQE